MSGIEQLFEERTLVFGHRGARAYAPMNTLPSFELAAAQGADGVELDVWLCGGREALVVLHDSTVDGTTDGSGFVYEKSLAELRELDASHVFAAHRGTTIPTLDEVFQAVGSRLLINVEIKADRNMLPGTEAAVADCIRRHGMDGRVIVSSFSAQVLRNFRQVMPDVPIGFLYSEETPPDQWALLEGLEHEAIHPHHEMVDAKVVGDAREAGRIVNTWTVNDPDRAVALAGMGVRGIITDTPDAILRALGR